MISPYGLVFYPLSLEYRPGNRSQFLITLQSAGFIGEHFEISGQNGYLIGADFLKLVTFLGCAPHIEVSPPQQFSQWGNFCYIELHEFDEPRYFKGLTQLKSSCPHCKSRVAKYLPDMRQWLPGALAINCPKCGQTTLTEKLNWRHGAGFGRFFIIVNSVYPNEAVPTDKLMTILETASNVSWKYFYFERET